MKIPGYLFASIALTALVACKQDNQSVPDSQTSTNSVMNSLVQSKDQFLAVSRQKMQDLDAKIQQLTENSADYKDDAKVQADRALSNLREQRAVLGIKYDQLKAATQDGWDKTKAAFSAAWDDMGKAYDDAKAKFK